MFLIWNGYAALLLLTLTQNLVIASLNHAKDKRQISANLINDCVRVPWMDGLDWVLHSSESSRAKEVQALIRGIESGDTWALQMLDTLLKIEKEIPDRKIQDIRINDQHIEVHGQNDHINVQANSCATISLGNDSMINGRSDELSASACNSLTKNESEVTQAVNDVEKSKSITNNLDLGAGSSSYARLKSNDFTTIEICAICVFLTVGGFIIACTICDIVRRISKRNLSTTVHTLSKFSLYTTALDILSTKETPQMMPAIHGIRSLNCLWVVIGHRYLMTLIVFGHKITALEFLERKNFSSSMLIVILPYAVDTFLLISGFLMTHNHFKNIQSGVKSNWPTMYLRRYFRLTPSLAALILFAGVLSHRVGSGPLWESVLTQSVNYCGESWWLYFLYIQNLVKDGFMFLPHCWYLALDMQVFWISPIILYPLHRWPKFGLRVLGSLLVASLVTPAVILTMNGYYNGIMRLDVPVSRLLENFENYYIPTYNRACPYLIGILLGYDLARNERRLTQVNVAINWLIAGILLIFCGWSTNRVYNSNFAYDLTMEITSTALVRLFWSIAVAWIIYACTQGYGGPATRFLSQPMFFPLSRLSYCIYLVHFGIQAVTVSSAQTPPDNFSFEMVYELCSDLVLSISVAFVLTLFVESPVNSLVNILMNYDQRKTALGQKSQKSKRR